MIYLRGKTYWYRFKAHGVEIRESAGTRNLRKAEGRERARREEIDDGGSLQRKRRRKRIPLFGEAAEMWLASRAPFIAASSVTAYRQYVATLKEEFGRRLVTDIGPDDIRRLQHKRLEAGPVYETEDPETGRMRPKGRRRTSSGWSARSINYELGVLRQILKRHRAWSSIADDVERLPERSEVGRAISLEHERKILDAIARGGSPALLPLFALSIDSGLRASEVRSLRRRDLTLHWEGGRIVDGGLTVPKSKTAAGTGRYVPFTQRVAAALTLWWSRFPDASPDAYVFPRHSVLQDSDGLAVLWDIDQTKPMGEWKHSWRRALREAGVNYRWHDLRHTFVSRLAESPRVSEQTIRSLAGHVSKRMLDRYSHIQTQAKVAAIAVLEDRSMHAGGTKGGTVEEVELDVAHVEPDLTPQFH